MTPPMGLGRLIPTISAWGLTRYLSEAIIITIECGSDVGVHPQSGAC